MNRVFSRHARTDALAVVLATAVVWLCAGPWPGVAAHDGPPYPVITDRLAGAYSVSIWTDPDTTDDGSSGGQFWVIVEPSTAGTSVPDQTRVALTILPLDRDGFAQTAVATREPNDRSRWFVALRMDHEGRFHVRVTIEGPLGPGAVETEVEATYDERPAPILIAIYAIPFLLAGFLWLKLIVRRRTLTGRHVH